MKIVHCSNRMIYSFMHATHNSVLICLLQNHVKYTKALFLEDFHSCVGNENADTGIQILFIQQQ